MTELFPRTRALAQSRPRSPSDNPAPTNANTLRPPSRVNLDSGWCARGTAFDLRADRQLCCCACGTVGGRRASVGRRGAARKRCPRAVHTSPQGRLPVPRQRHPSTFPQARLSNYRIVIGNYRLAPQSARGFWGVNAPKCPWIAPQSARGKLALSTDLYVDGSASARAGTGGGLFLSTSPPSSTSSRAARYCPCTTVSVRRKTSRNLRMRR